MLLRLSFFFLEMYRVVYAFSTLKLDIWPIATRGR